MKVKDLRRLIYSLFAAMAVSLIVGTAFAVAGDSNAWQLGQSLSAAVGLCALFGFMLTSLRAQQDNERVDLTGIRLRYVAAWLSVMAFVTIGLGGMGYGFDASIVWFLAGAVATACV